MDILFTTIPTLCVLQVFWYADMSRTADVVWNEHCFLSKQYKEELQGSKDILQATKMAQGPSGFNVNYQLLLERKFPKLLPVVNHQCRRTTKTVSEA